VQLRTKNGLLLAACCLPFCSAAARCYHTTVASVVFHSVRADIAPLLLRYVCSIGFARFISCRILLRVSLAFNALCLFIRRVYVQQNAFLVRRRGRRALVLHGAAYLTPPRCAAAVLLLVCNMAFLHMPRWTLAPGSSAALRVFRLYAA
jgi:hypothetical protein